MLSLPPQIGPNLLLLLCCCPPIYVIAAARPLARRTVSVNLGQSRSISENR